MIELSELIRDLRKELSAALADGTDETLRFELGPVELEATMAVDRDARADGKIRFWVVDASAGGRLAQSRTQRITLTLQPKTVGSDGIPRSALIAGEEADRER
ncbi:trypco2 family protein [Streptomyces sp. KR80]|uniref:trypco2 family protein n=1 Tax=Streptomyces sp. KR80 TaxID=3457426 RepID=UPI003FD66F7A